MWCCTRRPAPYPKSPPSVYFSAESVASRASTNVFAALLPLHVSHTAPISPRIPSLPGEFIGPVPPRLLNAGADIEAWLAAWLGTHAGTSPESWAEAGFPGLAPPDPVAIGERIKEGDVWTACVAEVGGMLAEVETAQSEFAAAGGYKVPGPMSAPAARAAASVVAKLVCLADHPLPAQDVVSALAREAWLYDHTLRGLQGVAVPRWHGVYAALAEPGEEAFAALMEHAGESVKVESLTDDERQEIVGHYERLHSAGVVHLAAEPKHWLRSPHGIRLIDFGAAILRPDADVVRAGLHVWNGIEFGVADWEMVARFEIGEVLRVLGFTADWESVGGAGEGREEGGPEGERSEGSSVSVGSMESSERSAECEE